MTKLRRQRTKDETDQLVEQLKLLEQFKREWRDRTPPTDRFCISPNDKKETNQNG